LLLSGVVVDIVRGVLTGGFYVIDLGEAIIHA
jgi:hypothetical protein